MSRALVKQADMLSALTELFPLWEETGIILINTTKNIPHQGVLRDFSFSTNKKAGGHGKASVLGVGMQGSPLFH